MIYNYIHIGQPITLVSVVRCATIVQARLFPALVEHGLQIARVIIIIITILLYILCTQVRTPAHTQRWSCEKKPPQSQRLLSLYAVDPEPYITFPPRLCSAHCCFFRRAGVGYFIAFFSFCLADVISRVKANVLRR